VLLGALACNNRQFATLHALAQTIAQLSGAKLGFVNGAANSVGAACVGALPSNSGLNAKAMLEKTLKAYVLLGIEAELDCSNAANVVKTLAAADMVVYMGAYKGQAASYATVMLPISPFTETAGTFVNIEGKPQTFNGVVKPLGDTRPAWKVLRVLGNMLAIDGFDQENAEQVRASISADIPAFVQTKLNNSVAATVALNAQASAAEIERIIEVPMYAGDSIVRRAPSLQKTAAAKQAMTAFVAADIAQKYQLSDGCEAAFSSADGVASLEIAVNKALPAGCVRIAAATAAALGLGGTLAITRIEKIAQAVAAE
jgi:NADH-quinone oxidoreductase subunit G